MPLWIYLLVLIPLAYGSIYSAIVRGVERMDLYLAYTLCSVLLQVVGTLVALRLGAELWHILLIALLAQIVATVLLYFLSASWRFMISFGDLTLEVIRPIWQVSWAFAGLAILAVAAAQLPIWVLRLWGTDAELGQFGAALRLIEGGKIIPATLFGAMFPQMVRGISQSTYYRRLFWGLVGLIGLGVVAGIVLAEPIIFWLYAGYAPAVAVLRILLLGLIPFVFRLRYSFELITQGYERPVLLVELLALALSLPIYYGLVRFDPLLGTGIAVVVSRTVQVVFLVGCQKTISFRALG